MWNTTRLRTAATHIPVSTLTPWASMLKQK